MYTSYCMTKGYPCFRAGQLSRETLLQAAWIVPLGTPLAFEVDHRFPCVVLCVMGVSGVTCAPDVSVCKYKIRWIFQPHTVV